MVFGSWLIPVIFQVKNHSPDRRDEKNELKTDEKNELLWREILLCESYKFKARIKERGNVWKILANNLNIMADEILL